MFRCIKTIKLIWVFEIISLLLAGCANVPDTVRDRAENSSVTDSLESKADSDLVFDKVENVTKNAASVLGNKYQNIVLPERIDVEEVSEAYLMKAIRNSETADVNKMLNDFTSAYIGEEPTGIHPYGVDSPERFLEAIRANGGDVDEFLKEWSEEHQGADFYDGFKDMKPLVDPKYCMVADNIGKYHIEVWSGGSIFAEVYDDRIIGRDARSSSYVYDPSKDNIEGISYEVAGEEYSLSEALQCAEAFMDNTLRPFLESDDDVKTGNIYVFEERLPDTNELAGYYYAVEFHHIIGGLAVSTAGSGQSRNDHMVGSSMYLVTDIPGVITEVSVSCCPCVLDKQPLAKLITLESALAHAEKELAPYEVYNIERVTLEYCAKEKALSQIGDNPEFEYHPMWCLTVSESEQCGITPPLQKTVLYVDAVNGEVMLWDDSTESLLFGGK